MNLEIIRIVKQLVTDRDIYFVVFTINGSECQTRNCLTKDEVTKTFGITKDEFELLTKTK